MLDTPELGSRKDQDMLGFKLEVPRREETLKGKARPIYLDMQVRYSLTKLCIF